MLGTVFSVPTDYERHFDVIRAESAELLREAYRIRYQVYCVENPYEDPEQQDGTFESDQEDDRAVHSLLLHRRTGEIAGTTRVILPDRQELRPLPVATLLHGEHRRNFDRFPAAQTVELSRFAVSKEFRRRRGEERYADVAHGDPALQNERRVMPYITLGLIRGMFEVCLEHDITHIAAVMEPPLIRILDRLGLHFTPIGRVVVHHGLRQPCYALLDELIEDARDDDTMVWQYAMEPLLRRNHDPRLHARPKPMHRIAV
jgi:N-acyl amino acid synthase of PEP-CTERM/exosortase system